MSGLPREAPCRPYRMENFCPRTTKEMFARIRNMSLSSWPGHTPSYSNLGITVLARILERQIGGNVTFEEWIVENVVKPLNLTDTGFRILEK